MVSPTAGDDNYVIDPDGPQGTPTRNLAFGGQAFILDIGSNDDSFFNDGLTYTIVSEPTKGSLPPPQGFPKFSSKSFIESTTITYLRDPATAGLDTFVYQVSDTDGNTDTATVSITLFSTPVANTDYIIATPGVPITIDVKANDTDADGQTLSLVPFTDTNENLSIGADDKII